MTGSDKKLTEIETTIEKFSGLIRSVIKKTSPAIDRFDLNDIEQEIKIKIWQEISKSEKKIQNLGSYIWRISYNTTCRIMGRLARQRSLLIKQIEENRHTLKRTENLSYGSPNGEFEKQEIMNIIGEAVNSLLESRRQVVKLYLSSMDLSEICKYLNWSEAKTRNLLYRGLEDLKKKLQALGLTITNIFIKQNFRRTL